MWARRSVGGPRWRRERCDVDELHVKFGGLQAFATRRWRGFERLNDQLKRGLRLPRHARPPERFGLWHHWSVGHAPSGQRCFEDTRSPFSWAKTQNATAARSWRSSPSDLAWFCQAERLYREFPRRVLRQAPERMLIRDLASGGGGGPVPTADSTADQPDKVPRRGANRARLSRRGVEAGRFVVITAAGQKASH